MGSDGLGRAGAARGEWLLEDEDDGRDEAATATGYEQNREDRTEPEYDEAPGTHWTMCSSSTGALEGHSTHFHVGRSDLHLPLDPPAEGLQMAHSFEHIPVLRDEVVSLFATVPPGVVVDATVGGGGHAAALLEAYPGLRVIGLDRDPAALEAARDGCPPSGTGSPPAAPFSALESVVADPGFGPSAGVLFDLGVSSPQLDRAERGFSFRDDGPLDMRMDPTTGPTAADLVNTLPVEALAALFRENGEGRLSGRIARAIVGARPLTSTRQLAEVVASAVPAPARRKGHPARRVFQALRIEVNDELSELATALPVALSHLAVGGVCAVISYHSGEDRLTKQTFAEAASADACARPACRASAAPWCVTSSSSVVPASHRRPRSLPTRGPRAPACGRSCGSHPSFRAAEGRLPDGASSRGHRGSTRPPAAGARRRPRPVVRDGDGSSFTRRTPLRVVPNRTRRGIRRAAPPRSGKLLTVFSVSMVVAALLAVVVGQAFLANGQVKLAGLQHELTLEQSAHRQAELAVAQLETPSRIVAAATDELHMVLASVVELPYVSLPCPSLPRR